MSKTTDNGVVLKTRIIRAHKHTELPHRNHSWWNFKLLSLEVDKQRQDLITNVKQTKKSTTLTIYNSSSYTLKFYLFGFGLWIVINVPKPNTEHKIPANNQDGYISY